MTASTEAMVRSAGGYDRARQALAAIQHSKVWATAVNYELWLHAVCEPASPLAEEIGRLRATGMPITESMSEELAATFLPRVRMTAQMQETGEQLSRQLGGVSEAIRLAHQTTDQYVRTLEGASHDLQQDLDPLAIRHLVEGLTGATQRVQQDNRLLEQRLLESDEQVRRLKAHLEQVSREASIDALTSLPNRRVFDQAMTSAIREADRRNLPLTVALVDIDQFKTFNDTWGHQTGDQVLRYVSSVINQMIAPPRLAARYGGEEFALIFPGEHSREVLKVMDALRDEVASRSLRKRSTNEELGRVTISGGLAQRLRGEGGAALLNRVDAALYVSKHAGRNCVHSAEVA